MNENIISIDGPAGSGKSSVAKEVAEKLGFFYLDSGSYYRALTFYYFEIFQKNQISVNFQDWFEKFNFETEFKNIKIETKFISGTTNQTILNEKNISKEIRLPEITEKIKYLANVEKIRNFVNENLRNLAKIHKLVMDGRDIGSLVFPDAKHKFFLTASIEVRAERRRQELEQSNIPVDFDKLKEEIYIRDETDKNRKIAPLVQPNDAILIDTSNLSKNVVINMILSEIS
jgi:CMP/dCMP kinase